MSIRSAARLIWGAVTFAAIAVWVGVLAFVTFGVCLGAPVGFVAAGVVAIPVVVVGAVDLYWEAIDCADRDAGRR